MNIKIHDEAPIKKDKEDLLGRMPLVEMISTAILKKAENNHECYIIGVYGKWGEGKTSVLNMVQNYLSQQKNKNIATLNFNPWILKNQESMLTEFFSILGKESIFKKCISKIQEYAKAISPGAGIISNILLPGSEEIAEKVSEIITNALPTSEKTIQKQKSDIAKTIKKSGKHIIVFIDDVDRLDNTEIHGLLKLVRQVADFPNMTYIIGMDPIIVSKSISKNFGHGNNDDGQRFLDKIIQIPIVLPQVETKIYKDVLQKKLSDLFKTTSSNIPSSMPQQVADEIGHLFGSLREIYRYTNQLSFVLPSLYKEVNIIDLCMLEAIKLFHIHGYNLLYENRNIILREHSASDFVLKSSDELSLNEETNLDNLIKECCSGLSGKTRTSLEEILKKLLHTHLPRNEWNLIENKNFCSDIYFNKYFMQSVPSNIIPDAFLEKNLTSIIETDIKYITEIFNNLQDQFSISEVKRAVLHWTINPNPKGQSYRASKISKALAQMNINNTYGYHSINQYGIDIFIAMTLIPNYMLLESDSDFMPKELDLKRISDTCQYIATNSRFQFCMSFLYHLYSTSLVSKTLLFPVFEIMKNRLFKDFDRLEIFKYSKGIQTAFFGLWKLYDKDDFISFIDKAIADKDFDIIKFISYHIDNTSDASSYIDFIRLFENKDLIINKLKTVIQPKDWHNPSIASFCQAADINFSK